MENHNITQMDIHIKRYCYEIALLQDWCTILSLNSMIMTLESAMQRHLETSNLLIFITRVRHGFCDSWWNFSSNSLLKLLNIVLELKKYSASCPVLLICVELYKKSHDFPGQEKKFHYKK